MNRNLAVFALVVVLFTVRAGAWDACGHKTVATIAFDQLTPEVRARVEAVFAADPRGRHFIGSATWPDDIKQPGGNPAPSAPLDRPWHYVNIP
jgi:hypothetical protein